jgi:general secretion pathway protein G
MSAQRGFSILELLIVLGIVATLAGIGVPAFIDSMDRGRATAATGDIADMSLRLYQYKEINGQFPDSLDEAGLAGREDPWGQSYTFLRIEGRADNAKRARTDEFLKPLNADFDLFSIGYNGLTERKLRGDKGEDDIVRAADGAYIGPARDF